MITNRTVLFVIGVVLAIVEAVQQYLGIAGYVQAIIAMLVVFLGGLGAHALNPVVIAQKLPLHLAVILTSVAATLNVVLQLGISMPRGVHVAIGVVLVILTTIGVHVTGLSRPGATTNATTAGSSTVVTPKI